MLSNLPIDIIFYLSSFLDYNSIRNLCKTNKNFNNFLYHLLETRYLYNRKIVTDSILNHKGDCVVLSNSRCELNRFITYIIKYKIKNKRLVISTRDNFLEESVSDKNIIFTNKNNYSSIKELSATKNIILVLDRCIYSVTNIALFFKMKNEELFYLNSHYNYVGLDKIKINYDYCIDMQFEPYNIIFKKEKSIVLHKIFQKENQINVAKNISDVNKDCLCFILDTHTYTVIKNKKIIKSDKNINFNSVLKESVLNYKHVVIIACDNISKTLFNNVHLSDEIVFLSQETTSENITENLNILAEFDFKHKEIPTLYTDPLTYRDINFSNKYFMSYLRSYKELHRRSLKN